MKDLAKVFLFFFSMVAVAFMTVCDVASLMVGQYTGVFWYSMGLIVSGVILKLMVNSFDF